MAQASAEKLEHTGPADKSEASMPQREQLASMPQLHLPTKKKSSRQSKAPNREGEGSLR